MVAELACKKVLLRVALMEDTVVVLKEDRWAPKLDST